MTKVDVDNILVFSESLNKINHSELLTNAVMNSNIKQRVITNSKELFPKYYPQSPNPANIIVSKAATFEAAKKYDHPVVLNFANAFYPGGNVFKGSFSQEESLCRCSTLYQNLSTPYTLAKFYIPHRLNVTALHNDDIIYTPDVIVFKSDNYTELSKPFEVNVITCAAPNLNNIEISEEELLALHEKRARAILNVARFYDNKNIILGAFGCGSFKNDPNIVAKAYKNVLDEYMHSFENIEFAIYSHNDTVNYDAFKKVF